MTRQRPVTRMPSASSRDIKQLDNEAALGDRQLREIAAIKAAARVKFTAELNDKLDRLERDIVKELTLGE